MTRNTVIGLTIATLIIVGGSMFGSRKADAGGTCHEGSPVLDERTTTVALTNNCMVPTIVRVDAGASVTWVNEDDAAHTVNAANFAWGTEELMQKGGQVTHAFDAAGVYPYFCLVHVGMIGVVVAGDGNATGAATEDAVLATSLESRASAGGGGPASDASGAATTASPIDDGGGVGTRTAIAIAAGAGLIALVLGAAAGVLVVRRRAETEAVR